MKKLLAIFLLTLYLLAGTELKQLLKIPVLVQHYQEHKAQDDQLGFADFIYMHYAGDDFNDQDQERDSQLPFKSCEGPSLSGADLIPSFQSILLDLSPPSSGNISMEAPQNFHAAYFAFIWQPPKARFI